MLKESSLYKVEKVERSSLFYNEYEWCVTINISEAHCLRVLEPARFERAMTQAKYWADNDRWTADRSWSVTKETALRETREVLLEEKSLFKTVVSFNTVSIYTNRQGLANRLLNLGNDGVTLRIVRQAVITRPAGVIQLQESQYAYRTYFRERKYNKDQKNLLLNFLNSRRDTLRPCTSLMWWLNYQGLAWQSTDWSRAHYFVDHDHPNEGTMISLVLPGIVRKTMPIETTK